jgi:CRP-like cAMP-binding protein
MDSIKGLVFSHPVFSSLAEKERAALGEKAVLRILQKGENLAMQGDDWPYLFLVSEGQVDALKVSTEGRNLLVTTFGKGELFWGLAFFQQDAPQVATLQAACPTRVHLWPRQELEPVFRAHGSMGWELCNVMIQRMQRASAILEEMAFQPVAGRLARLLLDHFEIAGEQAIDRSLTLDEMAARLGTTREMVCRVLYRFSDNNLINVTRTEFVLTDRQGLLRLVDGS